MIISELPEQTAASSSTIVTRCMKKVRHCVTSLLKSLKCFGQRKKRALKKMLRKACSRFSLGSRLVIVDEPQHHSMELVRQRTIEVFSQPGSFLDFSKNEFRLGHLVLNTSDFIWYMSLLHISWRKLVVYRSHVVSIINCNRCIEYESRVLSHNNISSFEPISLPKPLETGIPNRTFSSPILATILIASGSLFLFSTMFKSY
jgi:hypothetical protein